MPGTDPPQSVGSSTLFYPMNIMPKNFIDDYGNLKPPKYAKRSIKPRTLI